MGVRERLSFRGAVVLAAVVAVLAVVAWSYLPSSADNGLAGYESDWEPPHNDSVPLAAICRDVTYDGSGTRPDPYAVATLQQLRCLHQADRSAHYRLTRDIDASPSESWHDGRGFYPIRMEPFYTPFNGAFKGTGHTIEGLTIDRPPRQFIGLFGTLGPNATVTNLTIRNADVTGVGKVGILAGHVAGTIHNVTVTGTVNGTDQTKGRLGGIDSRVGGLVGVAEDATITNVTANVTVSSEGTKTGGLVGEASSTRASVSTMRVHHAHAQGPVEGHSTVGGLVGETHLAGLTDVTASGDVTADGVYGGVEAGGLIGHHMGIVTRAAATGDVDGDRELGGLIGSSQGNVEDVYATGDVTGNATVAGLVAQHSGTLTSSYAAGNVTGRNQTGGLVATLHDPDTAETTASYWDVDRTTQQRSAVGTGLTTRQMTGDDAARHMEGFDFDITWRTTDEYPTLQP